YIKQHEPMSATTHDTLHQHLSLISRRARGEEPTQAAWMRGSVEATCKEGVRGNRMLSKDGIWGVMEGCRRRVEEQDEEREELMVDGFV
ncbi:hypothetical protein YB2330_003006, partial [Saitoella coloradoensis]